MIEEQALDEQLLEQCSNELQRVQSSAWQRLEELQIDTVADDFNFAEISHRSPSRYDLKLTSSTSPLLRDKLVARNPLWWPVVEGLLGRKRSFEPYLQLPSAVLAVSSILSTGFRIPFEFLVLGCKISRWT